ncbi:MAG: metal-sensing transcriptional repressor [Oscillospiraceae bacterium]|jgi:DNA-binding FrmR family transcriptional regulator|nr:metal-sensing transcriptional repressor [Oscillospiraceae bacterium]
MHSDEKDYAAAGFHVHADGTAHSHGCAHAHGAGPGHTHSHVHTNKKAVHDRLAKARGHLDSVIRMIDDDRDCSEVLVQLAAVRSAINNAGKVLLQDHITECITEAIRDDDRQKIADLNKAIEQFMK